MTLALYLRAIRGPVLLMTLGALLALHKFGYTSFWKLWPVLVIVLGLMKLLEMMAARAPSEPGGGLPV